MVKVKTKKLKKAAVCCLGLAALGGFCWWQNNGLMLTRYSYCLPAGLEGLNGVCIAHISDLHNKDFDGSLVQLLKKAKPDLVVITGDIVGCTDADFAPALALAEQCASLAPTCYVPGNHEGALFFQGAYGQLRQELIGRGVHVLENQSFTLDVEGGSLHVIGLLDPLFSGKSLERAGEEMTLLIAREKREGMLNLVLSHRPSLISAYAAGGADLVFCGHAHGGQVRLPLVGGLIAPDEGFFPTYTSGVFQQGNTTEVVSRGLGNSRVPLRLFNRPELVLLDLKSEKSQVP